MDQPEPCQPRPPHSAQPAPSFLYLGSTLVALSCRTLLKHTYFLRNLSRAPRKGSIKTIFELGREISQVFFNLVPAPGHSQLSEYRGRQLQRMSKGSEGN